MGFNKNGRLAVLSVILLCLMAVPFIAAQSFSIIQENSSGAYLGITMEDVTSANVSKYKLDNEKGVIVSYVRKGSPAEEAKLKVDDVILGFGGQPVWSSYQLSRMVKETPAGRKVGLVISRDGKELNLSAVLASDDKSIAENQARPPQMEPFRSGPFNFRFGAPNAPNRREDGASEPKPRLGITLQPLTEQLAEFFGVPEKKGVLIASVISGSVSDGKLKSGDVIIGADNKIFNNPEDVIQFVQSASGKITLKIVRDRKIDSVVIDLPSEETQKGYKL